MSTDSLAPFLLPKSGRLSFLPVASFKDSVLKLILKDHLDAYLLICGLFYMQVMAAMWHQHMRATMKKAGAPLPLTTLASCSLNWTATLCPLRCGFHSQELPQLCSVLLAVI